MRCSTGFRHRAAAADRSDLPASITTTSAATRGLAQAAPARARWCTSACETLSQLQDRVVHEPATLPGAAAISDRAGQRHVPRSRRTSRRCARPSCRCCAPIRRSRSGSPAAAPAKRCTRWPSCCAKKGCSTRTHHLRHRHQSRDAARRPRRASTTPTASPASPRTIGSSGARSSLSEYYTAHYGARGVRQVAARQHRVLRSQPGDRQRLRRGAAGLVPQRADLLRPRAAGSRGRPVSRRAVPQGLPRLGSKESLRFSSHARRVHRVRAEPSGSSRRRTAGDGRDARCSGRVDAVVDRRLGRRRRGAVGCCCRRCRPTCARAGLRGAAPAARAAEPARRALSAALCRRRCARRGQGAGRAGHGVLRAARLPPAVERGPSLALSVDEPVNFSRPSIDVLFESAADVYRRPPPRRRSHRRQPRRRGRASTRSRPAGADRRPGSGQRTRATMVEAALQSARTPDLVLPLAEHCAPARYSGPRRRSSTRHRRTDERAQLEVTSACSSTTSKRTCSRCPRCCAATTLEVLPARSGAEALELLLLHDVALALVDVQMPDMDGFELAELMRGSERTRHVPIIFVTAGARDYAARLPRLRLRRGRLPATSRSSRTSSGTRSTSSSSCTASGSSSSRSCRSAPRRCG